MLIALEMYGGRVYIQYGKINNLSLIKKEWYGGSDKLLTQDEQDPEFSLWLHA